jgi:predicted acyltransferase
MTSPVPSTANAARLTSLDQFRGYTMLGMLLVNFLGNYSVCPRLLKHTNDYCSYADTIMPQFLFAAGFAMRLSLCRRLEKDGRMPWGRAIRRIMGLAAVAIVWYTISDFPEIALQFQKMPLGTFLAVAFKRTYFQTLLHIAGTSLWILPVVILSARVRIGYLIGSALLHLILSWWFNFEWVFTNPTAIDGGPLGFLSWSIPALAGTLAYDAVHRLQAGAATRLALSGLALMLVGWTMSCATVLYNVHELPVAEPQANGAAPASALQPSNPVSVASQKSDKLAADPVIPAIDRLQSYDGTVVEPPFVPPPDAKHRKWNYWMMCQRCASLSYLSFGAGFSQLIFAGFLWACDGRKWNWSVFRTLGTNSLAAYILHDMASWIVIPFFPKKSALVDQRISSLASTLTGTLPLDFDQTLSFLRFLFVLIGFLCLTLIVYSVCRLLERRGWYIRV